jgi:FkbM family methyltransferase
MGRDLRLHHYSAPLADVIFRVDSTIFGKINCGSDPSMLAHSVTPKVVTPSWARSEPIGPSGHHLIFDSFHRTAPYDDDRYHFNFMGARIAHELERDLIEVVPAFGPDLANGLKASGRSARYGDDPAFPHQNTEDYFEWIDLLTAIDRSRTQFTMIEAGAGYGRWISNAAAALKRRKKDELLRPKLVALEASKARFDLMVRNCEQNEIPGSDLTLMRAACTPDGSPVFMVCNDDYGAGVSKNDDAMRAFELAKSDVITAKNNQGQTFLVEKVPAVRLGDLLTEPTDFLDIDIQGAELDVVFSCIDSLDEFVKLIHIGTHSAQVDARLSHIFHLHGWRARRIFSCGAVNQTPYGTFQFIDGIQSWENPKFE